MSFKTVTIAFALCACTCMTLAVAEDNKPKAAAVEQSPKQAGRQQLKARPTGDKAIIHTVADAMGFVRGMGRGETTNSLNRLQWIGAGQMTEDGVAYPVTRYSYQLSFHLKATREDFTRSEKGKSKRYVRVVLGEQAWDEREPGIDELPASDSAQHRRLAVARTPLGFTRALLDADPATVKIVDPGPSGKVAIAFTVDGAQVGATLNTDYRPETITMKVDGKEYVERYRAYKDLSEYGIMFATRWQETIDGKPHVDLTFTEARVASYAVFPKPISSQQAAN
jgi:hypothetical protein